MNQYKNMTITIDKLFFVFVFLLHTSLQFSTDDDSTLTYQKFLFKSPFKLKQAAKLKEPNDEKEKRNKLLISENSKRNNGYLSLPIRRFHFRAEKYSLSSAKMRKSLRTVNIRQKSFPSIRRLFDLNHNEATFN